MTYKVGDKVRVVSTHWGTEEIDCVDAAGELLRGQTGTVEHILQQPVVEGAPYSGALQYFVRTKNRSLYGNGTHAFFGDELEHAEISEETI